MSIFSKFTIVTGTHDVLIDTHRILVVKMIHSYVQNLVIVTEYHVAVTSALMNFRCHKSIADVNK